MKNDLPLPQNKKLTVMFRVEPGSLGPQGKDHIGQFCAFAQKEVESIDADFVHWEIVSRDNKALPEMQYKIGNKYLTHDKAAKYLIAFNKDLDEFEGHLLEKLALLIDYYREH